VHGKEAFMLNSILETRKKIGGLYNITLQINDKEYLSIHEGLREDDAFELLQNYLRYRGDDGRVEDIKIKHDRNAHLITINADLYYDGNSKTEQPYQTHDYLHHEDRWRMD